MHYNIPRLPYPAGGAFYVLVETAPLYDTFFRIDVNLALPPYDYTNDEYFELLPPMLFTKGRVVYFMGMDAANPIPANHLNALLDLVCNYLYYFVLWRWYNMLDILREAEYWYAELSRIAPAEVRRILTARQHTLKRPMSPFC